MSEFKEYRSNSNKARSSDPEVVEEKREVEKANIGAVKVRKRSGLSKFRDSLIKEDARNVGDYVMSELFIPRLIDMVVDMGKGAIEMFFYGETRSAGRRDSYSRDSRISYRSYYDDDRRDRYRDDRRRDYYDYDELSFQSRRDAEEVLDGMYGILENPKYGKIVTVADLFDLAGEPSRYTDNKWGWTDLRGAYVRRSGRDYVIELPRPLPID